MNWSRILFDFVLIQMSKPSVILKILILFSAAIIYLQYHFASKSLTRQEMESYIIQERNDIMSKLEETSRRLEFLQTILLKDHFELKSKLEQLEQRLSTQDENV